MTASSPLEVLVRRRRPVLFTFLLVSAVILAGIDLVPRQYAATATLRLAPPPGAAQSYRLDLADRLMNTYATLVATAAVQAQLRQRLSSATPPTVWVEMPANTQLLRIHARHPDAGVAAQAANEMASILIARSRTEPSAAPASPLAFSLIEAAKVPAATSWPDEATLIPAAILLAVLGALAIGFAFERLDPTVHSVAQLAAITDAPVLGQVPRWRAGTRRRPAGSAPEFREAFRSLALALKERVPAGSAQTVLVTGCAPGDGASTVASNLASAAANQGARALIVDCNLRRPALHQLLDVPNDAGLGSVLRGRTEPPDGIRSTRVGGLSVLPSGPVAASDRSLLDSESMRELLRLLARHFDLVVLDAASLADGTDAARLAAHAGGTVLVVRRGSARGDVVRASLASLDASGTGGVGLVLNR